VINSLDNIAYDDVHGLAPVDTFPNYDGPDVPSLSQADKDAPQHEGPGSERFSETGALDWSGTPGSNRRPSPWQGADEDVHGDATRVKPLESKALAEPASTGVLQADAAGINGVTDAGLTETFVGSIPDDRLFTVAEVAELLKVPKSAVYSACDRRDLQYVKFEGAVQVEGRDLKAWLAARHA